MFNAVSSLSAFAMDCLRSVAQPFTNLRSSARSSLVADRMRLPKAVPVEGLAPYVARNNLVSRTTSMLAAATAAAGGGQAPWGAEESKLEPEGPMGNLCKPRQRMHSDRKSSSCKPNGYAVGVAVVVKRPWRGKRV